MDRYLCQGIRTLQGIKLTEYLSEYEKYGKAAPLKRNISIIESVGFPFIWIIRKPL